MVAFAKGSFVPDNPNPNPNPCQRSDLHGPPGLPLTLTLTLTMTLTLTLTPYAG